ncbi:MAG: hypothetical protein WCV90_08845 [Candidatus Woesearchaeota archaeon]|jgi:hypothetical protein
MIDLTQTIRDAEVQQALRIVIPVFGWEEPKRYVGYHEKEEIMSMVSASGSVSYGTGVIAVYCEAVIGEGKKHERFSPTDYDTYLVSLADHQVYEKWDKARVAEWRKEDGEEKARYAVKLAAWKEKYKDVPDEPATTGSFISVKAITRPVPKLVGLPIVHGQYGLLVDDYEHKDVFLNNVSVRYLYNERSEIPREFKSLELSCEETGAIFRALCQQYEIPATVVKRSFESRFNSLDENPIQGYMFQQTFTKDSFSAESLEKAIRAVYQAGEHFSQGIAARTQRLAEKATQEAQAAVQVKKVELGGDFGISV